MPLKAPPLLYWIYDYPSWAMAVLFTAVFAAASVAGLFMVRRFLHGWLHRDARCNEMVGFAMSSFSMLYGLLLGLLAVAAYQGFSVTSDVVTKESATLSALYRASGALPDPVGHDLETLVRGYTREVIDTSWPLQQRGIVPTGEHRLVDEYFDLLHAFEPATMREQTVQAEALTVALELVQVRRTRMIGVTGGIPGILWAVVLAGALINLVLLWMLDMALHTHVILTVMVGGFLGLVIFLVAAMDYPFRGEFSVTAEPLEFIYDTLMTRASPSFGRPGRN